MRIAVLVVAALLGGCSPYPRHGFVILVPSSSIAATQIHGTANSALASDPTYSLTDAIADGAHLWDVVGCQFILQSEAPNAIGPTIDIVEGGAGNIGDFDAWYNPADGKIHVSNSFLSVPQFPQTVADTIAHEIGHSIGLGHLQLPKAGIMSVGSIGDKLSADDVAAFDSLD